MGSQHNDCDDVTGQVSCDWWRADHVTTVTPSYWSVCLQARGGRAAVRRLHGRLLGHLLQRLQEVRPLHRAGGWQRMQFAVT